MSTLTEDDTLIIEFLEFLEFLEFGVPCVRGGDHEAIVIMQCRFCPHSGFLCRRHLMTVRLEAELRLERAGKICCAICFTLASSFEDLFTVVNL